MVHSTQHPATCHPIFHVSDYAREARSIAALVETVHAQHTDADNPPVDTIAGLWGRLDAMHEAYLSVLESDGGAIPPVMHGKLSDRMEHAISVARDCIVLLEAEVGTHNGRATIDARTRMAQLRPSGGPLTAPLYNAIIAVEALASRTPRRGSLTAWMMGAGQAAPERARRAKRSDADVDRDEVKVATYLFEHPGASRDEIADGTRISAAHVSETQAWRREAAIRKEAMKAAKARGLGDDPD